ncbi:MAG: vitamin K epoxide reductase family protein, partial [Tepidisphaeraceae bacterium]
MTARDEISRTRPSWPWWRWTVMGLSLLGLALSVYLSWHALLGAAIGCGGGSSCDQILSSRWSTIGGVLPVSGLAVGTYLAILLAGLAIGPGVSSPVRKLAWRVILVLASAAAGSAVWFTIVQRWLVRAFCPYCMAAHFTGVVLAILVIWQAPKQMQGPGDVPPTRPRIARYPVIGFVLAGILAACQVGIAPPPAYRSGVSQPP